MSKCDLRSADTLKCGLMLGRGRLRGEALPAVRPDPELATDTGRHAYAARLRQARRRRKRDLALEHTRAWWLNWGAAP